MRIPKLKKWEPIELRWIDSMADSGWKPESAHTPEGVDRDLEHLTVGYFFMETPRTICVIQSRSDWDYETKNVDGVMSIPKVAVLNLKRLSLTNTQ
jgi:hypothetical protein